MGSLCVWVQWGNVNIARFLVNHRATDLTAVDNDGLDAHAWALEGGHSDIAALISCALQGDTQSVTGNENLGSSNITLHPAAPPSLPPTHSCCHPPTRYYKQFPRHLSSNFLWYQSPCPSACSEQCPLPMVNLVASTPVEAAVLAVVAAQDAPELGVPPLPIVEASQQASMPAVEPQRLPSLYPRAPSA